MIDQHEKLREVAWNELFRWLILLRSVRIALMARVIVLGALGLLATTLGWHVITWIFSASSDPVIHEWQADSHSWLWSSREFSVITPARSADELFLWAARGLIEAPVTLWLYIIGPFVDMFDSNLTPVGFLYLLLCGAWEVLVWGLFGGAITRIAALKFTRDEAPDVLHALKHSASKLFSYSAAPMLALAGSAVFGLQLVVLGLLMRIGFFAMLAGLIWPFVLMLGLMMAILLIGALVGWPLMWATVSVEGTDAFDALSRSYAYTYQRPLRLLWYVLFATVLAAVSMFVVKLFATTAVSLGSWSVSWGLDDTAYRAMVTPLPPAQQTTLPINDVPPLVPSIETAPPIDGVTVSDLPTEEPIAVEPTNSLSGTRWVAARSIAFWKSLLGALVAGYQAGFIWVAAVGIYLLLRKDVDGAEMDEIYVEDEPEYGMPALDNDFVSGIPDVAPDAAAQPGHSGMASVQP